MRYVFGFMCVLALGLMGCSETSGAGGSGGIAGNGGVGGDGGGIAGNGGAGGMTGQEFPCTEQGIRDAIALGGGPHTFDCDGPQTVVTEEGIVIDNDVELDGEANLVIDANGSAVAVEVYEGVTAVLSNLTITNAGDEESCEFGCGGVSNDGGALTLIGVTVSEVSGTGIRNFDGTLALRNVTVSDCDQEGIVNESGQLTLTGSTVSRSFKDGIINFAGTMTLTNCTVLEHDDELGIANTGTLTVMNTLVDRNCDTFDGGITTSNGYNIESPDDTCGFDHGTDLVNITEGQLDLEPLADNGGPTMTHEPGAGSVAIDHIPVVDCEVDEDQRGEPRPGGAMCDVGAFEVQP